MVTILNRYRHLIVKHPLSAIKIFDGLIFTLTDGRRVELM